MSFFKEKTPNQQLFNAVAKANVQKVRKALDAGANVNEISTSNTSPLDVVAQSVDYYNGSGFYSKSSYQNMLNKLNNLRLVWNELVLNNGQLHKYKNDEQFNDGFEIAPYFNGSDLSTMEFKAPKKPRHSTPSQK